MVNAVLTKLVIKRGWAWNILKGWESDGRKIKPCHIHKNNRTPGPAHALPMPVPCPARALRAPGSSNLNPRPSCLLSPPTPSKTHIIPAPPQLAELSLGPAQLGLKVQDFVLGCALFGGCVLLGLFHLPRKQRGGAGLLDMGHTWKRRGWAAPTNRSHCGGLWSLRAGASYGDNFCKPASPALCQRSMSHHLRCETPV